MKAIFNILFISLFVFCLVIGLDQCGEGTDQKYVGSDWGGVDNILIGLVAFFGAIFFLIILGITNLIYYFINKRKKRKAWENDSFPQGEKII